MLHAIAQVPRTSFTAGNGINTEEFVNCSTIVETACGRYGDLIAPEWDVITGVDLTVDDPLSTGGDTRPLQLVKTVESHRVADGSMEIVERLCHTVARSVVPIRVKYMTAARTAEGTHRCARSYIYHGNLPTIFGDLVPASHSVRDFGDDFSPSDPKMIFAESARCFSQRAELAELAEEVTEAVHLFHKQNPLMYHITPNLYSTEGLATMMAPYLDAMMTQTHVRMDRATQNQVWSPNYIQTWVDKAFSHDVQVFDPLTGKAISGGYHPRYLLGHLHGGQTLFDTSMPPAIQFDVDVIDTAPPELRAVAYAIDMFPVTDFVAEIDVRAPSDVPVRWLGYCDRYLGVWPLTTGDIHREGVRLAKILRQTFLPHHRPTVLQAARIRLTKTFADEALLEFFGTDGRLIWGAYFDFARLSLGSVGVADNCLW